MNSLLARINSLGFNEDNGLFFLEKSSLWQFLPLRTRRLINTIRPYAFYCIDNKPFILFFEGPKNIDDEKALHRKIWNAQLPVIIIEKQNSVEIFNGFQLNQKSKLLKELASKNDVEDFSFWNIISERTWIKYKTRFQGPRLDEYLLDNIQHITDKLSVNLPRPLATALILRLIFIRYLIDREVDLGFKTIPQKNIDDARQHLIQIIGDKAQLYKLFSFLGKSFNGNLFDSDFNLYEYNLVNDNNLYDLQFFISGGEIKSGQFSLFDLYDFNIIPVELVSNIYERVLGADRRKKDGAFYTPLFLVEYILKATIQPFLRKSKSNNCLILDPSCGSGAFLVEALRLIIEKTITKESYIDDDELLSNCLEENIYGIDKNEEAINVAIFSLYITLLDYKNPKKLKGFNFPFLKGKNFIANDFFNKDIDQYFKNKKFDFIIGNPPWGSQKGKTKDPLNYHFKYVEAQNSEGTLINDFQIAESYLLRIQDFTSKNTTCALIITSKLLYNLNAKPFRDNFLTSKCTINLIVELSAVRKHIFQNAIAPSAIAIFRLRPPSETHEVKYVSLKPNSFLRQFRIIVAEKYDIKHLQQSQLRKNDWLWKVLLYGNVLDFIFIHDLFNSDNFNSLGSLLSEYNIQPGAGYKVGTENRNCDVEKIKNLLDVLPRQFSPFRIIAEELSSFENNHASITKINGIGKIEAYKAPHLLIKRGAKLPVTTAYLDFECCFPNTIFGLHADKNSFLLKSIGAILSSQITTYLNFMLSPQWGIERDEIYLSDYQRLPIPKIPIKEHKNLAKLYSKIENAHKEIFINHEDIFYEDIDKEVFDLYEINPQTLSLIKYSTEVSIPLFQGSTEPFAPASEDVLRSYIDVFVSHFENIFNEPDHFLKINIYQNISEAKFVVIEFLIEKSSPQKLVNFVKDVNFSKEYITRFSIEQKTQFFYEQKDIISFETNSFFIAKPNELKNWHSAIAHLDLGEVMKTLLDGGII